MPVNSTTPIKLKDDDKQPKEVKEIAIICRKSVEVPFELMPSSSTSTPVLVMLCSKIQWAKLLMVLTLIKLKE